MDRASYGEQGNVLLLLMGTWEHEQIFQGRLGTKWILGSNLEFLLKEHSKTFLGIREILEVFLGNMGA